MAAQWATRLVDLLEDDPHVEAELQALVEEVRALLPVDAVSAEDHSVAAGRDVNVKADRGGVDCSVGRAGAGP